MLKNSTKNILEGNWNQLRGSIQRQWGKVTDDDLAKINGSRTELAGVLQKNYGLAEKDVEKQINDWEKTSMH